MDYATISDGDTSIKENKSSNVNARLVGYLEGKAECAEEIANLQLEVLELRKSLESHIINHDSNHKENKINPDPTEEQIKSIMTRVYNALKKEFSRKRLNKQSLPSREISERCKLCIRSVTNELLEEIDRGKTVDTQPNGIKATRYASQPNMASYYEVSPASEQLIREENKHVNDEIKRRSSSADAQIENRTVKGYQYQAEAEKRVDDIKNKEVKARFNQVQEQQEDEKRVDEIPKRTEKAIVSIKNCKKSGNGRSAHVLYELETDGAEVERRYRDFQWLSKRLMETYYFVSIPLLPPKESFRQSSRFSDNFLSKRQRNLEFWISYVSSHYNLRTSSDLQAFLGASPNEWKYIQQTDPPRIFDSQKSTNNESMEITRVRSASGSSCKDHLNSKRMKYVINSLIQEIIPLQKRLLTLSHRIESVSKDYSNTMIEQNNFQKSIKEIMKLEQHRVDRSSWYYLLIPLQIQIRETYGISKDIKRTLVEPIKFHATQVLPVFQKKISNFSSMEETQQASTIDRIEVEWNEIKDLRSNLLKNRILEHAYKMQQESRQMAKLWEEMRDCLTDKNNTRIPICDSFNFPFTSSDYVEDIISQENGDFIHYHLERPIIPPESRRHKKWHSGLLRFGKSSSSKDLNETNMNNHFMSMYTRKREMEENSDSSSEDDFVGQNEQMHSAADNFDIQNEDINERIHEAMNLFGNPELHEESFKHNGSRVDQSDSISQSIETTETQNEELRNNSNKSWDAYIKSQRQKQRKKQIESSKKLEKVVIEDEEVDTFRDDMSKTLRSRKPRRRQESNSTSRLGGKYRGLRLHQKVALQRNISSSSTVDQELETFYAKNVGNISTPTSVSSPSSYSAPSTSSASSKPIPETYYKSASSSIKTVTKDPTNTLSKESSVEGGWIQVKTEDGRTYYYHKLTRATRWKKPDAAILESMEERILAQERETQRRLQMRRQALEAEERRREKEQKDSSLIRVQVESKVKEWAYGKDIIRMLQTIHEISPITIAPLNLKIIPSMELNEQNSQIKKAYMKAVRLIHPDKLTGASLQDRLFCQSLFSIITNTYEKYREKYLEAIPINT